MENPKSSPKKSQNNIRTPLVLTVENVYCVITPFDEVITQSISRSKLNAVKKFLTEYNYPDSVTASSKKSMRAFSTLMQYGFNVCVAKIETKCFIGPRRHLSTKEVSKVKRYLSMIEDAKKQD